MTNGLIKPPVWFWIVSVLALVWNAMGVFNYLMQAFMTPEQLAAMSSEQQAMYADVPAWVTAAFAIAVFSGTIGCILLLLRKRLAYVVLIISFIAVMIQMFHGFFLTDITVSFGYGLAFAILLFGIGLVFFARKAIASNWIG